MIKKIKENIVYILIILGIALFANIRLPYYVSAPGGVINILDRIESKNNNGSLNMLYVTEFEGTPLTILMSLFSKNYNISKIEEMQISNESNKEIKIRNKVMLDNSINNALFVAYKNAGRELRIVKSNNIIIATSLDNGLMVGDIILKCDGIEIDNITEMKEIISNKEPLEYVNLVIQRDKVIMDIDVQINEDNLIGVAVITNYEYDDDDINIKFKNSEGGSSGGLMLALAIYQEISGIDLMKGRNIAGTGTIDNNGNVGPIDGVKYKIIGANKHKMDIVLIPHDNYEEAKKVIEDNHYNMKLYEVYTFEDAINYLIN